FRLGERHQERGASREAMRYAEETMRIADALRTATQPTDSGQLADAAKQLAVESRVLWANVCSRLSGTDRDVMAAISTAQQAEKIADGMSSGLDRLLMLSKACRCLAYMYLLNERDTLGIPPVHRGLKHAEAAREFVANDTDWEVQLELANAKKSIGLITYKMDRDPESRGRIPQFYQDALDLADQILAGADVAPKTKKLALALRGGVFNDRSMYWGNLGVSEWDAAMMRQGFDDAVEAVKVSQAMLESDPLNNDYRHRVSIGYWNVADRVTYFGPCDTEIEARRKSISAAMPLLERHRGNATLEMINLQRFRLCSPLLQRGKEKEALIVFRQILASGMPLEDLEGGSMRDVVCAVLFAKLADSLGQEGDQWMEPSLTRETCLARAAKLLMRMKEGIENMPPESRSLWLDRIRVRMDAKQALASVFEQHPEVRLAEKLIPLIDETEKTQRFIDPWPVP
ncbi:MAG: hypothetical protein AAFU85_19130, partial [Planctomycetota bacterium]